MKTLKYSFELVEQCEMCGDDTKNHLVLGQRLNQSQGMNPKSKTGISVSVMRCRKCDLIYSQPQPIPNDIQDHYGTPAENYWKPEQFNYEPNYFSSQIDTAKDLLPFKDNMAALDIGAGLGKCMISLSNAGFETFGLEPSKPFYERALSKMNISPDKLKFGMVEEIEYDDQYFDFITYGAVFEHIYHPALSLKKALSWLKPDGIIHIEVPSSNYTVSRLTNLYFKLIGTNYVTNISPMHSPFHLYEFGLKSFEELGKKIGFKVEKYNYDVAAIVFGPKMLHPILEKYMKSRETGMQLTLYLRKTK